MRSRLSHLLPITTLVVVLVGAAACSSSSKSATTSTSTPSVTTVVPDTGATTSTVGGTTASSTAGTSPTTASRSDRCRTTDLEVSLGQTGAAAGNRYTAIVFTNTSGHACTLYGYPGVSLLDGSGHQIGPAASREPGHPLVTVTLAPDGAASAAVHTLGEGVAPNCLATSVKLRVYVPDERAAVDLSKALANCGSVFSVFPVASGTSGTS